MSVQDYQYPGGAEVEDVPDWSAFSETAEAVDPGKPSPGQRIHGQEADGGAEAAAERAVHVQRLAEEKSRSFEEGKQRGVQEGRQAEREEQVRAQASTEENRVRKMTQLIESFAQERARYIETVEPEVVKLALAVAARILRREAQMDPLLLTGAVRVALGQLAGSTEVRLKVPPADLDLWKEAIALLPNLALKPAVVAGEGMRLGDCTIETSMGTVDLGVRAQLGEIERGFFDRAVGERHEASARRETRT